MFDRKSISSVVLTSVLSLLGSSLHAQLNPKWQTINSPDFLNLYQQSNAKTLKPEIVTVFDFSGSMRTIMYDQRLNPITDGADGNKTIEFTLTRSGGPAYTYTCTASLNSGYSLTNGALVRPDGSLVTAANINSNYVAHIPALNGESVTPKAGDVRNWIRSASHVRFSYTVGGDIRTIDLPIPWTVLDDLDISATNPSMTMYNTYPLKMTIKDPVSGTEVEMDSRYYINDLAIKLTQDWSSDQMKASIPIISYQDTYTKWLFNGKNASGKYWIPDVNAAMNAKTVDGAPKTGFANKIPSRTRTQAVKDAALRVWVKYYDKVFWAFRFLNNSGSNQEGSAPGSLSSDTKNYLPASAPTDPPTSAPIGGTQRGWLLMNKHSLDGMRRIAVDDDGGTTPLNTALANTYAQFNDPDSVFNEVEIAPDDTPQECMKHFVLLFTDGQPNTETGNDAASTASPYINAGAGNVQLGNSVFAADKTQINPRTTTSYFNILNLSALAAHGGDSTQTSWIATPSYPGNTTYPAGRQAASTFLPFWISSRNGTSFNPSHPIQTMTIGVSLQGDYNTTSSPKYRMFAAACLGDPALKNWNLNTLKPFALSDPGNPSSPKDPNSVYFFDATDPQILVTYLEKAFEAAAALSQTNATTAPVLPTMGTGLGAAVYLSKFVPPKEGGPVWPGDLLMYPIKEDSTGLSQLLDGSGNVVSDFADPDQARWAASKILKNKLWFNRTIYTRTPATSSEMQPSMRKVKVNSSDTASTVSDSGYLAIKSLLPGGTDAAKFDNWRYFVGASMPITGTPPATRADIMGDVINSAPAVLDYSTIPSTVQASNTILANAWSAHSGNSPSFRVIFVGTNQGFLHAFGEVSWKETVSGIQIQNGVADELWAFAPTDLLPFIDYYRNSGNAHRFGVDGSPTVYRLDLPPTGAVRGNGVFDVGSTSERAIVIFGLGKGGRSYYAIDVRDPAAPVFQETNAAYGAGMGWAFCPDEPFNYPAGRFQAPASSASQTTIQNMGLSTALPTIARLAATSAKVVKDIVFISGGFSLPEIETNLPAPPAAGPNKNQRLGRSVIALDAKGGAILGVWDLTSNTNVGPVSAGVVPYTFFSGSGMHQRAYFADYWGGVWALGYAGRNAIDIRQDSSWMDQWSSSPRPVYTQSPTDGLITSLPIAFAVPNMPIRTSAPLIRPAAVGLAFVTGDRNNPIDIFYTTGWPKPDQHRLNVIFDRQDSYLLGLDSTGMTTSNLAAAGPDPLPNLSADERNPAHPSFYLNTKYGYYVQFPARSTTTGGNYVPKGMFSPMALGGHLYYSYFNPTAANPCTGGAGITETFHIKNLMFPDATNSTIPIDSVTGKPVDDRSGKILVWSGVASPFAIRNLVTGVQAGMSGGRWTNNNPSGSQSGQMQNLPIASSFVYPMPRIWRTVQ